MTKFMEWLSDGTKGLKDMFGYVVLAGLIVASLQYCVSAALMNWGITPEHQVTRSNPFQFWGIMGMIEICLKSPLMEELIFRVLPLSLVIAFVSKSPRALFGVTIMFALLFGAIHPYSLQGKIQVGIAGFFFGLVFLKCGGMKNLFIRASVAAVLAHGLSNFLSVLLEYWEYLEFKV